LWIEELPYNVARRTSEIGIRMALGAHRGRVVRMILNQVLVLAVVGLAIGVSTALGTSKLVASFRERYPISVLQVRIPTM